MYNNSILYANWIYDIYKNNFYYANYIYDFLKKLPNLSKWNFMTFGNFINMVKQTCMWPIYVFFGVLGENDDEKRKRNNRKWKGSEKDNRKVEESKRDDIVNERERKNNIEEGIGNEKMIWKRIIETAMRAK